MSRVRSYQIPALKLHITSHGKYKWQTNSPDIQQPHSTVLVFFPFIKMKFIFTALLASAITSVSAAPTPTEQGPITARQAGGACATAVTLSGNPFAGRSIYANKFYSSEVATAAASITDSALKAKASKVAQIGTYLWM
jgi:hypothetical protein